MDMQNVSNLQIPEGQVRTIHDKDSRLIWGRVAYNTKYVGDTYQQTYSGKNLWQIRKENQTVGQVTYTYNQDGTFSLSGDPTGGGTVRVIVPLASSGITPGQAYTIWTDHGIGWGENQVMYYIQSCKADGTWVANIATFTNAVRTQTVASTDEQYIMFVLSWSANGNYTNFNNVKAQLVAGSTADSDFEPYTAGPAPNPDYPQDINMVTGEQIITISDGQTGTDFIVDLGNIELCKIRDYQDYIYKSGDDWYVHKETGKKTLSGSDGWTQQAPTHTNVLNTYIMMSGWGALRSRYTVWCNMIKYTGGIVGQSNDSYINVCSPNAQATNFLVDVSKADFPKLRDWTTFLNTHNLLVYYVLATPTDTKITNTTLVAQLNAVHQWATRYGYNVTVSGDLPVVLQRDSLQ